MRIARCKVHGCDKMSTYSRLQGQSSLSEHGVITGDQVRWHEASRARIKFVMA
jgi:hypothetical protein